jgi:hypothetical protein
MTEVERVARSLCDEFLASNAFVPKVRWEQFIGLAKRHLAEVRRARGRTVGWLTWRSTEQVQHGSITQMRLPMAKRERCKWREARVVLVPRKRGKR